MESNFSLTKDDFIKTLTSGSLNISLLDDRSKDAFDRGNKLLEEIVSVPKEQDIRGVHSEVSPVHSKSSIDSWSDSFKQIIDIDITYILQETNKFKIHIPSVVGVPFEVRESLKTLQSVMKRCEQSRGTISTVRRKAVEMVPGIFIALL